MGAGRRSLKQPSRPVARTRDARTKTFLNTLIKEHEVLRELKSQQKPGAGIARPQEVKISPLEIYVWNQGLYQDSVQMTTQAFLPTLVSEENQNSYPNSRDQLKSRGPCILQSCDHISLIPKYTQVLFWKVIKQGK